MSISICIGVMAAFLLDFPFQGQALISLAIAGAVFMVGDFVDALLCLWQAIAVAGFIFVLIDYASDIELNEAICAFSIPIVWFFVLLFKSKCNAGVSTNEPKSIRSEIVGAASMALLFFVIPRGQLQTLSFLGKGEDSALYMWASSNLLRGQELHLATGFSASSYLYFYSFLNNGFLYLSKLSVDTETNSLLIALNVLSNEWVFVLMSSILFGIRIVSVIRQRVSAGSSSFGLYILIAISSFLFFRASQDVGHFTQYLLNCATLVFLLTLITASRESQLWRKLGLGLLTLVTTIALVGSYAPWFPMSMIGIALTINAFFRRSLLRLVLNSKSWFGLVFVFVLGWAFMLRKLYSSSNLEMGGGVAVIPLEAVWLVFVSALILIGLLIIRRVRKSVVSSDSSLLKVDKIETLIVFATVAVLSVAILNRTSFNQLTTLGFVILVGLLFRPISHSNLIHNFDAITVHEEFDGVIILAFTTFLYTLSIYLLSRFIGPIYEPMYAANKSMFAFFGQFSWLFIVLIFGGSNSQMRIVQLIRRVTVAVALFLVLGLSNFIRYDETQRQWWHEPFLAAIKENPDALIACVNPILTTDYEAYKCNHFISVLTSNNNSVLFERLSLGDPLGTSITDWFSGPAPISGSKFDDATKVIVLSTDELGADALSMFAGVSKNMIEFRVVKH